jgi:hypothetical protein
MPDDRAILVLGAPRTGTSCVAGMLAAGGARVPGPAVRNWDNAHGHFEATAAVRLSDRVLSLSGGSWMQAPTALRWDAEAEAERDRLLQSVDGRPVLLKDPRMLLCWPFWAGGGQTMRLIGTVRHPLAAARSMSAWRRIGIEDGLRLWLAHASVLLDLARSHGVPLVDIDAEPAAFLARMTGLAPAGFDLAAMTAHYDPRELHHDGSAGDGALLDQALIVHAGMLALLPASGRRTSAPFPWAAIDGIRALLERHDIAAATALARTTLTSCADPVAVLLPLASDLLRANAAPAVLELATMVHAPPDVDGLLRGKALLALHRATEAVAALEQATAGPTPFWEARSLLAQALHAARRRGEARSLLLRLAPEAVHPAGCLSTAAEWAWRDRDHAEALRLFAEAATASPPHRRGRLRCRRAELLLELERRGEALAELDLACAEDPAFPRARELQHSITAS